MVSGFYCSGGIVPTVLQYIGNIFTGKNVFFLWVFLHYKVNLQAEFADFVPDIAFQNNQEMQLN